MLLDQIPPDQEIAGVTRKCHDAIAARGAAAIIPQYKNARPWKPDTPGAVARDFDRQVAEFQVRVAVLNGFTALGTPLPEVAGQVCPGIGKPPPSDQLCNRAGAKSHVILVEGKSQRLEHFAFYWIQTFTLKPERDMLWLTGAG